MNTIQAQAVLPLSNNGKVGDITANKSQDLQASEQSRASSGTDFYSSTAANDSFVARVLSTSIGNVFSKSGHALDIVDNTNNLDDKYSAETDDSANTIDIELVTNNVVSFVESALGKLATNGADEEKLSFFRDEAVKGVEIGIDQAKLELIAISDDALFSMIDKTKDAIVDGLQNLSISPITYQQQLKDDSVSLAGDSIVKVTNNSGHAATIEFDPNGFDNAYVNQAVSYYTTSASTISFAVARLEEPNREKLANLINDLDSLASTFYRSDLTSAYETVIDKGFSNQELIDLAKVRGTTEAHSQVKAYEDIQNLSSENQSLEMEVPKAVTDYINKYLSIMDVSKESLQSEQDFNDVLNGLVNQMKDVQVPDLLQAINRFHAFNSNFVSLES